MQRRPVQLVLSFSLFLLAACNSPTSTTPHATATPVPSSVSVYYSALLSSGQYAINALDGPSGKLRWSYATSADGADSPLVLAEGVLYFTTSTSLIALNARDGTLRWNTPVPPDSGIIGEENGILYVSLFPPLMAIN